MSVNSLVSLVRGKVSRDRFRFRDFDHDLDLSYITSNIVAMAFPSSGIESVWRNHIDEVSDWLRQYHEGKFKIWNLSGKNYNYSKFNNQVLDFGFPDHHSPPLELLFRILSSIHEFLTQDPKNVAVIHCIGGKGRTGTVIVCYLVYAGIAKTTKEAMEFFAKQRSSTEKGVTQPSQRRYAEYFEQVLNYQIRPYPKSFFLKRIIMHPVPNWCKKIKGCRPMIRVFSAVKYPKELIYSSYHQEDPNPPPYFSPSSESVIIELNYCLAKADTIICFYHIKKRKIGVLKWHTKIMRITFHSAFINDNSLTLKLDQIDDERNRSKWKDWFDPKFEVKLEFEPCNETKEDTNCTSDSLNHLLTTRTSVCNLENKQELIDDLNFYNEFFKNSQIKANDSLPSYSTGSSTETPKRPKRLSMLSIQRERASEDSFLDKSPSSNSFNTFNRTNSTEMPNSNTHFPRSATFTSNSPKYSTFTQHSPTLNSKPSNGTAINNRVNTFQPTLPSESQAQKKTFLQQRQSVQIPSETTKTVEDPSLLLSSSPQNSSTSSSPNLLSSSPQNRSTSSSNSSSPSSPHTNFVPRNPTSVTPKVAPVSKKSSVDDAMDLISGALSKKGRTFDGRVLERKKSDDSIQKK